MSDEPKAMTSPPILKLPFQRELTVIIMPDETAKQADADLAAVRAGGIVTRISGLSDSQAYFYQLRLRATEDPALAEKIAVFFLREDGVIEPVHITDDLRWPRGFGNLLWNIEIAVKKAREAQRAKGRVTTTDSGR